MRDRKARAYAYYAYSDAFRASGPAQPFPYSQLDAYLKASPRQRASMAAGGAAPTPTKAQVAGSPPPPVDTGPNAPGMGVSDQTDLNSGKVLYPNRSGPAVPPARPTAGDALPGLVVTYNAPKTLPLDLATDFRLFIAPAKTVDDANFRGAPGAVTSHPLAPVKIVRAVLSGPRQVGWVDIDDSKTTPCQTMDPDNKAEWDWFVTPRTTHHLVLTVKLYSVTSCDEAAPTPRLVDNFDIPVTASLWEMVVHFA